MSNALWFLVIGLLVGGLAELTSKDRDLNILGEMIVGAIGAVLGGWLFSLLGITAYGFTGALVMAAIGAVAMLAFVRVVKRA